PPFPDGTAVHKVLAHVEQKPRPLPELRKDVPAGLARVVERMLAKDPAQRYQTPAEVARALQPFTGGKAPRHRWLRAARRPLLLAGGLVAALLVLGIFARDSFLQRPAATHGGAGPGADGPALQQIPDDRERLQGTWKAVAWET